MTLRDMRKNWPMYHRQLIAKEHQEKNPVTFASSGKLFGCLMNCFQNSIAVAFHFIHSFLDECHVPAIFASWFSCANQFALLMLAIDCEIHAFAFSPMMSLCSSTIWFTLRTFNVSHSFLDEWQRFSLHGFVPGTKAQLSVIDKHKNDFRWAKHKYPQTMGPGIDSSHDS